MLNYHSVPVDVTDTPADLIASLREVIRQALAPLLPRGERVALIDFPNHANAGDSAIWVGELAFLREAACEVVNACDLRSYSRGRLASQLKSGTILLHGGGNLGDLYPKHQAFRERVIGDFPDKRIILLPQTIYFQKTGPLHEARRVFNAHPRLTLLVRDRQSLETARNEFLADSLLVPDMAFYLTPVNPGAASLDTVCLLRNEVESAGAAAVAQHSGIDVLDWPADSQSIAVRTFAAFNRLSGRFPNAFASLREPLWNFAAAYLARRRVARACDLLSQGRVIVTDRLHGHILSLLLGRPHVVLENSYGKIGAFVDTWTSHCPLTHRATSFDQAIRIASTLAHGHTGTAGGRPQ